MWLVMREKIIKQVNAWLPVVLWAALIFHFSSGSIPVASTVYWQDFAVKKTGHVLLFGALTVLIYRALRMNKVNRKKAAIVAVVLAACYGASDEYHQMFTQGREARIRDVFIDSCGATLVMLTIYYLPSRLSKKIYNMLTELDLI
jgi:hypothetical protein